MIALPTIFFMNFVEVWQSTQTCRVFIIRSGAQGAVLMNPNAIASFSLWSQTKHLFFFFFFFCFHIMQKKFHIRHIPSIMHEPSQSLQFCTDFNHLRVVLIISYKSMHLIIHFNPGEIQLFLHTSFFSLPFNTVTEMPAACSSKDV